MRPYLYLLCSLLMVTGLLLLIDPEATASMTKETGIVEVGTAVLYVVLVASLLFYARTGWLAGKFWYALMAGLLLCRELDLHKAFTTMGIFKSRFYESPDVPVVEKACGAVVVLAILVSVVFTFVKSRNFLFQGIRQRNPIHVGILVAFCLAVMSQLFDGLHGRLEKIGLSFNESTLMYSGIFEEVLEVGIPIALIIAVAYTRNKPLESEAALESEAKLEVL